MAKQTPIYYLPAFVGQESRHSSTGSPALVFLKNLAIKLSAKVVVSSEVSTGKELASVLTYVATGRIQFPLVCWVEGLSFWLAAS